MWITGTRKENWRWHPKNKRNQNTQSLKIFSISEAIYLKAVFRNKYIRLLDPDIDTKIFVELNNRHLQFFENELSTHPDMPTIVFCHAPLLGTQFNWEENDTNLPKKAFQPAKAISSILNNHKQVFMWVSGHTHTPPTVSSLTTLEQFIKTGSQYSCPAGKRSRYGSILIPFPR